MESDGRRSRHTPRPPSDPARNNLFNILDSRGAVSTTERADAFKTMRGLARKIASLWIDKRAELGHPLLNAFPHAPDKATAAPTVEPAPPQTTGHTRRHLSTEPKQHRVRTRSLLQRVTPPPAAPGSAQTRSRRLRGAFPVRNTGGRAPPAGRGRRVSAPGSRSAQAKPRSSMATACST
ncbi:glycine--tRNA ligase subunit alpha [Nocardiopsis alkaliphila]|uniref:glycine--tRNA ligase subunit alpha n=1 Tax=Nocardiopsis alkaliphila TaxID=225762 RepID=UPI000A0734BD|nr:glycine--tRNA ligase subunit alpha [Nocardiopsis alkaliphila]